jgi:hypothetical protein
MKFKSTTEFLNYFWFLVNVREENECWPWLGNKTKSGSVVYGTLVTGRGFNTFAHQLSFILANGYINDSLDVMHSCDNGLCENPKHLLQGTRTQNMKDCFTKGRKSNKGFNHSQAKLSEQEALSIFYIHKHSNATIAKLSRVYKLSTGTVGDIVRKKHWATRNLNDS